MGRTILAKISCIIRWTTAIKLCPIHNSTYAIIQARRASARISICLNYFYYPVFVLLLIVQVLTVLAIASIEV